MADAINFLTVINNLLTFTLSNADGLDWRVFCPHIQIPWFGKFAIGFTLDSYNSSLSDWVNFSYVLITDVKLPLFNPAGAYHGAATESLNDNAPGTTTDGGTNIGLFFPVSIILTHGKYVAV